ncbi:MAG TPA: isochorismatase family cysteine hydrolase [Acetobacteraceae bacterium]|nr:isochorismatase family cysteine hydrolase [Acetobacteraceae bacterium]
MSAPLSREVEIDADHAALLFVDIQNYNARPDGGEYAGLDEAEREARYGFFFRTLRDIALPNMQRLQLACRRAGIEVMYTVIENLTVDGRDRSLDYKISGLHVPRGSWDAKVLDAIAPGPDEMVIPKSSSSVFISTNIDYVLRNLGVRSLMIAGGLTDQCIDSAIRDACDLGYLVTAVTDACVTLSPERHDWALRNNRGYCRQRSTAEMVAEIERLAAGRS